MTLLNRLPFFPLYYNGKTKFAPIHCSDLTDIIYHVISKNIYSKIIECVGPEIITFKEILERLLNLIGKKRFYYLFHLPLAEFSARFFEIMPKPLLTRDQLRLLKYDNIASGKYKKLIQILVFQVKDILMMKLKNIVICGEKVDNFLQKNIYLKNDLEKKKKKIKLI